MKRTLLALLFMLSFTCIRAAEPVRWEYAELSWEALGYDGTAYKTRVTWKDRKVMIDHDGTTKEMLAKMVEAGVVNPPESDQRADLLNAAGEVGWEVIQYVSDQKGGSWSYKLKRPRR